MKVKSVTASNFEPEIAAENEVQIFAAGVAIEAGKSRRGIDKYSRNPFITEAAINTRVGVKRIRSNDGRRMMVVSETTGELIAPAGFWHAQEVDKSQFVKLYVNGVKALRDLSNAGTKVFEILYREVQNNIGKDVVFLGFTLVNQDLTPISKTVFFKGMREILEKGFIAESTTQGRYFTNPDYMWNGDRLTFVKDFRLKGSKQAKDTSTRELFDEGQPI